MLGDKHAVRSVYKRHLSRTINSIRVPPSILELGYSTALGMLKRGMGCRLERRRDLQDGYFPYELKFAFPDGVPLAVTDRCAPAGHTNLAAVGPP